MTLRKSTAIKKYKKVQKIHFSNFLVCLVNFAIKRSIFKADISLLMHLLNYSLLLFLLHLSFGYSATTIIDPHANYNKRTGEAFLKEISKKKGVVKLRCGMYVEIIKENTSQHVKSPNMDDLVDFSYNGTFKDGKVFVSDRGTFVPYKVILVSSII